MRRSLVLLIAVMAALTGVVLGATVGWPRLFAGVEEDRYRFER